jgi:hypothetical protein
MSGCSWSWPYWKFGLKKDDLTTSLHDRYNTVTIPILDPEAFHHDVCEIAHLATSPEEFLGMLEKRKEQRLQELNEILESAALEIIANPTFIGNEQWQPAIQLFRTRSFDSLVRFFASYLPADHPWYKPAQPKSGTCYQDSSSGSFDGSSGTVFDEPESMSDSTDTSSHETLSSKAYYSDSHRSMTMCSDSSVASPSDNFHDYDDSRPSTPGRAYSFSESEPDCCPSGTGECNCREQFSSPGLTSNPGQYTPGSKLLISPDYESRPNHSLFSGTKTCTTKTYVTIFICIDGRKYHRAVHFSAETSKSVFITGATITIRSLSIQQTQHNRIQPGSTSNKQTKRAQPGKTGKISIKISRTIEKRKKNESSSRGRFPDKQATKTEGHSIRGAVNTVAPKIVGYSETSEFNTKHQEKLQLGIAYRAGVPALDGWFMEWNRYPICVHTWLCWCTYNRIVNVCIHIALFSGILSFSGVSIFGSHYYLHTVFLGGPEL